MTVLCHCVYTVSKPKSKFENGHFQKSIARVSQPRQSPQQSTQIRLP
eukprot:COSAG02_NODE_3232_length_7136_cov_264.805741_11_plen_47_part_00